MVDESAMGRFVKLTEVEDDADSTEQFRVEAETEEHRWKWTTATIADRWIFLNMPRVVTQAREMNEQRARVLQTQMDREGPFDDIEDSWPAASMQALLLQRQAALSDDDEADDNDLSVAQKDALTQCRDWLRLLTHWLVLLAQSLKAAPVVMRTAHLYLWHYYFRKSAVSAPPFKIVCAALFLASKVEEDVIDHETIYRKAKDVARAQQVAVRFSASDLPTTEMMLFKALHFRVRYTGMHHALRFFLQETEAVGLWGQQQNTLLHRHIASAQMNDMHRSDLVLRYPMYVLAAACICLTSSELADVDDTAESALNQLWKQHQISPELVSRAAMLLKKWRAAEEVNKEGTSDRRKEEHGKYMTKQYHVLTAALARQHPDHTRLISEWHTEPLTWRHVHRHILSATSASFVA